MPVRILQVARPAVGGMAGHIHTLCTGLDHASYEITLACPTTEQPPPPGVHHIPLPMADRISPVRDCKVLYTLLRLKRNKYDLVHAHGLKAALLASLAFRTKSSPPLIITLHNSLPNRKKGRRGYVQDAILRWVFKPAAQVIVVSGAQADDLCQRRLARTSRLTTIHNGIKFATSSTDAPTDTLALRNEFPITEGCLVVLMVGRMIAAKGVGTLLKAADILLKTGSFLFFIAGDGPDREDFISMADTLGLRQSVRFLGYRQDIPTLLKAADLFVLPSLSEGLPLSVLEAMAAKRAIVATRVGGIPELVEDGITGLLVNPGDAVALAEAINALANDPDRRISMGMAGRLRVEEHFTETRMLNELSGVYLSAIADLNYGPCLGSQIIH